MHHPTQPEPREETDTAIYRYSQRQLTSFSSSPYDLNVFLQIRADSVPTDSLNVLVSRVAACIKSTLASCAIKAKVNPVSAPQMVTPTGFVGYKIEFIDGLVIDVDCRANGSGMIISSQARYKRKIVYYGDGELRTTNDGITWMSAVNLSLLPSTRELLSPSEFYEEAISIPLEEFRREYLKANPRIITNLAP